MERDIIEIKEKLWDFVRYLTGHNLIAKWNDDNQLNKELQKAVSAKYKNFLKSLPIKESAEEIPKREDFIKNVLVNSTSTLDYKSYCEAWESYASQQNKEHSISEEEINLAFFNHAKDYLITQHKSYCNVMAVEVKAYRESVKQILSTLKEGTVSDG